jgi:hypothetical protein
MARVAVVVPLVCTIRTALTSVVLALAVNTVTNVPVLVMVVWVVLYRFGIISQKRP